MKPITFENISITGINYKRLLDIQIEQSVNNHATAKITCEFESNNMDRLLAMGKEGLVRITTSAEGQPNILFCGVKKNVSVQCENEYKTLLIELASTSYLLDIEKKERTFQNTQMSCEELMNKIAGGKAFIQFNATDKPVGSLIYQANETDWELLKRIASIVKATITANINTEMPMISVGIPISSGAGNIPDNHFVQSDVDTNNGADSQPSVKMEQFMPGGSQVTAGGGAYYLNSSISSMSNGTLKTTYTLGDNRIFQQEKVLNQDISGKILSGIVQDVNKDKVKVHFDQVDSGFDSASDTWFEYSTVYASNGGPYGSGFYFMPEKNDRVKVFFPSAAEETGFAFSSECVSPLSDPMHVKWRAPGGQEILFTETGIRITGIEDSIFIELIKSNSSEYGITVKSTKDINLNVVQGGSNNTGDVNIYGKEKVVLFGDSMVSLRTPDAQIHVTSEKIVTGSKYFYID